MRGVRVEWRVRYDGSAAPQGAVQQGEGDGARQLHVGLEERDDLRAGLGAVRRGQDGESERCVRGEGIKGRTLGAVTTSTSFVSRKMV
jgi:hypothetical protein